VTEERRQRILRVLDGHEPLIGLVYIIHSHPMADVVLTWLFNHGYTGKTLEEFFKFHFAPNPHRMIEHILSQRITRPILIK
jgi:hypothetical protein